MLYWDSIAESYDENVLSPLADEVRNPLFDYVRSIPAKEHMRVLDAGCGTGTLISFLSGNFREVWAIDRSEQMLAVATARHRHLKNVFFRRIDMRRLSELEIEFDVIFAINSILSTSPGVVEKIVAEIYEVLTLGGSFIAVWPSFDTVIYQRDLTIRSHVAQGMRLEDATREADKYFVDRNKLDTTMKTYADNGVHSHRVFGPGDVSKILVRAGLELIQMSKVIYPWSLARQHGYGFFPGEPEIWDWFSVAKKCIEHLC